MEILLQRNRDATANLTIHSPTCAYADYMHTMGPEFEFSRAKNAANLLKHRVSLEEAATCFQDSNSIVTDDFAEGEERWIVYGYSDRGRLLAVCFTTRGDVLRLISARKATASEKATYARRV